MQPGDILPLRLDPGMIGFSYVIAALGAYVALLAAARIRSAEGSARIGYVAVAAIAFGGVGIWGMHFVGMIAQVLPLDVAYGLELTLLSLLVAVGMSGFALWYMGRAPFSARRCLAAGVLSGCGIAAMHYLGIAAMRMDAYFEWRPGLVALSVLIAIAAATASLWLAFRNLGGLSRMAAALVAGVAISGMHYMAQTAGIIVCTTPRTFHGLSLDGSVLPYAIALIAAVALIVMRIELHRADEGARADAALQAERALAARHFED
jgi:NO-binding membrane sensor protein with MHYT domain